MITRRNTVGPRRLMIALFHFQLQARQLFGAPCVECFGDSFPTQATGNLLHCTVDVDQCGKIAISSLLPIFQECSRE
jgi:hypothetical protein